MYAETCIQAALFTADPVPHLVHSLQDDTTERVSERGREREGAGQHPATSRYCLGPDKCYYEDACGRPPLITSSILLQVSLSWYTTWNFWFYICSYLFAKTWCWYRNMLNLFIYLTETIQIIIYILFLIQIIYILFLIQISYILFLIQIIIIKIQIIFRSTKDRTGVVDRTHVVYQIPCKDCNSVYIGRTKR